MTYREKRKDWLKSCGAVYLMVLGVSLGIGILLLPIVIPVVLIGGIIYTSN